MQNPLIVSTAIYDGYRFDEAFRSLEKIGITSVELAFIGGYTEAFSEDYFCQKNADTILTQLADCKLVCPSFSSHVDLTAPGIVDIFKKRMDFAKAVGAATIITNAAPTEKASVFYRNMKELAQHAADLELIIGLENPGDGATNVVNQGQGASAVIQEIGSKWVGVNYDFGNLLSHCFEKVRPEDDYKECLDDIVHYHIKDVLQDDHGWHFTEIGGGSIDYTSILADISAGSSPKPISLEIPLRLRRDVKAQPSRSSERIELSYIEDILQKSIHFVDRVTT